MLNGGVFHGGGPFTQQHLRNDVLAHDIFTCLGSEFGDPFRISASGPGDFDVHGIYGRAPGGTALGFSAFRRSLTGWDA
ncbi:hypothetical protein GCM10010145_49170 [Streptomyces ruber]|uniref:Uncharacterized protein n=2 Tax=Streptomyces TaxID=1883 RepID=A0A918BKN8_9ACTN|nr:hypothetical protein GCM10010145_49170 [Streptomyces ruber]